MQRLKLFKNHRVLKVPVKNTNYISHNTISLNRLYVKRFINGKYKYVSYNGCIYDIKAVKTISGIIPKEPLKFLLESKILFSLFLNNKLS